MTLLSVVLPVYKVQGYLSQGLDSLLEQPFADFEIVAVDDCSPDNSGAILAEYAARDPRVRVVSLAENVGLGRARNAGLDHATGEYVWFVDSDDWLAQGALTAVADRLADTDADVLIVGFDRVHWDGRVTPSGSVKALAEAPESFTVEQWPRVLNVLHVAWNKVVRRDLLLKLGFRFEEGWYEDVSFTFPLLSAAPRISGLARVCVHYRQRRTGAITRTLGDRHFEIFDHWAHAMALVDQYADRPQALRPALFQRMIWHYLTVLRNAQRVKKASRKRFFDRITADFHRYKPAQGYEVPPGAQGLRHRFVARGSFFAFRTLQRAIGVVKSTERVRKMPLVKTKGLVKRVRQAAYRAYYKLQLRLPVDDRLALYAAYWYRGVTCNPAAIASKAEELAPGVRNVWVVGRARAASVPPGTDYVVAGSLAYYRALARARWLVNNVNWPNWVVKRPGATHVMTHHGTPLKMMGMDQADHPAAAKDQNFHAQMRRADRWDFSITANAHTTIAWERAYPCRYETLEVGYPRNDRLAGATPADAAAVREKLGIRPDERVILYTPTHREWLPRGRQVLDVEAFAERLGPDTVLLVRAHYFYVAADQRVQTRRGRVVDVSAYPVVEDLYLAADVMMTDYSSAMFDFAVLDRPLVIYAPDWQAYRELRGVYFDLMELPPGEVATTFSGLVDLFADGSYASAGAAAKRARFRERFCYLDDGKAAERVVRRVLLGELAG
ncbi:bifunctional glycosyltransferase family 2 protein/CDP-glycerol:glycerophosphate glycerophosphotransferase [Couchioplanes caeruleus]|uniref:bifunctional glycosyltransferase/CDP-glycerol:glycerophosphate glycerophosphotransferase n=1 Tax=Couchioplanes caeruleus TaxID=56438 RepID=UPI0020BF822A|nr:bifunctional glycosyltransferase family 2 protein/CDP-glycerol:glycerophosphate glycerophosphotransferase [Couchioplanes caeruleus]UQU64553.1 bifunctional glycosyltransferase family 2 protein/CDP-glycerol:glycerophosphate glycerophosphotransferase [Couchioplanes caeruleus]